MSVYEAPTNFSAAEKELSTLSCGANCDWGFGVGIVIAMIGPLPGPT